MSASWEEEHSPKNDQKTTEERRQTGEREGGEDGQIIA